GDCALGRVRTSNSGMRDSIQFCESTPLIVMTAPKSVNRPIRPRMRSSRAGFAKVANRPVPYRDAMAKTYVGSHLRRLRDSHGLSQAGLAERLGISPSYLNQLERGKRPLTVSVLVRVTEEFGVDADFFATRDNAR